MARALIVGCGCHGGELGAALVERGWAVRGTTRDPAGLERIESAGIEPALADPDRPGTILELVGDVTVVVWLLGSATGPVPQLEAIHGPRLERLLERLVDTPVRAFAYECVGGAPRPARELGAAVVAEASRRWRIPTLLLEQERGDVGWSEAAAEAVVSLT